MEFAEITLDNFVVFVGNNNSGKTMVMQLIYGLRKELENFIAPVTGIKQTEMNGQYLIRCDQGWFKEVELGINKYLDQNKSRIIGDIFGMSISAEELRVELKEKESTYFVSSVSKYQDEEWKERKNGIHVDILQYENGESVKAFENQISDSIYLEDAVKEVPQIIWRVILSEKNTLDLEQLFLPASRSGLQFLYKYYFAGGTEGNLVVPIKDFLRFLQLYAEDQQLQETRKDLLEFGEKHLLQGKVTQKDGETFYIDKIADKMISLYMASSMIHELTPFMKALGATQQIDWLYCDEVENSLHPLLQREMARWLIRMVNAGMHVMVSSHSDTMASRLNNLFMLSYLKQKKNVYEMLLELGLTENDLLRSNVKAGVYEFRTGKQGKTVVEKLEFIDHPLIGYDFKLFGSNLDKLYNEADRITG
ncbi:MAG: ATP-binding protein [Lachnospiraceae bacterium]|nr:ATP-binding protein [Lachnospiraceae bacterium]